MQKGIQAGGPAPPTQAGPRPAQACAGVPKDGLPGVFLHHLQLAAPHPHGAPQAAQTPLRLPRLSTDVCHAGEYYAQG